MEKLLLNSDESPGFLELQNTRVTIKVSTARETFVTLENIPENIHLARNIIIVSFRVRNSYFSALVHFKRIYLDYYKAYQDHTTL